MIRIFHLIKGLGRGGAETLLKEGLDYSDRSRFTYGYGFFLPWKDALANDLREMGADVTCFQKRNAGTIVTSIPQVSKFLQEWKADLVHCHLPLSGVVGRLACKKLRIPVIYTEHNVIRRYHPWTRFLNLSTWKMQEQVIAVSNEVAASIREFADHQVPVRVIQNGIPVERFIRNEEDGARIRQRLGIPDDAFVIGTVAVFRLQKNLPVWLRAADILRKQFNNIHFLLIGAGQLEETVKKEAGILGLEQIVHFPGLQSHVLPFYSAMDVYMNSSDFEGLPLSILEAMAMNLPVVATSVGGLPEVVVQGKTGFLVPPQSPELLAQQVTILLKDPQMRREFGLQGCRIVEENFGMKRMQQELENLYSEILKKRSQL